LAPQAAPEGRPNGLRILFLGIGNGTSGHRCAALQRLGHDVTLVSPYAFLPRGRVFRYWTFHTGAAFLERYIQRHILKAAGASQFDLVWVDNGELIGASLVRRLKRRYGTVVNYNVDDPFSPNYGARFRLYRQAIPEYSLVAVVRDVNVAEAKAAGAKSVLCVYRSADEIAHRPRDLSPDDWRRWASDVLFVGTWFPERGPFLAELIERGVPLAIYGDRWQKAKEWPALQPHWRGPGLYNDDDYARAIQCAKISLGLLSKGNRDLHTTRSLEIPSLGGLFCAERTPDHLRLYKEGEEAVFWSGAQECAEKCFALLACADKRSRIARAGRNRCLANQTLNEPALKTIIEAASGPEKSEPHS
jgi:hypothetical protein